MVIDVIACKLCGLSTTHPILNESGDAFCCPACREVSGLLAGSEGETAVSATQAITPFDCETTILSLGGLWCPSCAWLIHEGLRRSPGVADADVSFIQREARISYDPAQVGVRDLKKRIRRFGYRAWQADETTHDEEEAHWIKLLVTGVITMHVMVLSFMLYLRQWTGRAALETEWLAEFFELMIMVLSVPVVLILGLPILRAGLAGLMRGRPSTHTLIAIGSFSAFALSLRNFIVGTGGIYFDTAAILLFLLALGRWFEMQAQKASGESVERLWEQIPQEAAWMTPEGEQMIAADAVQLGARIRVRPGERFPVDAVVATGMGDVDESVLTGEPDPVLRREGDRVLAGTVSLDGAFEVITMAVGTETVVGQIGRLLHQALWQRAPVERLADKLAAWMVPTAVFLAAGTFAFWTWYSGVEAGLVFALSVLLIACPCALGIATPLTLWLGLGQAAKAGVILRNTGVLEKLNEIEHLFFDKTGTITKRPIRLQSVAVDGVNEDLFLTWVTAVEAHSAHPLGKAIIAGTAQKLERKDEPLPQVERVNVYPGQGVSGYLTNVAVTIGNRHLMAQCGLLLSPALQATVSAWQAAGLSIVYAGWGGQVRGLLGLGEEVREETAVTLQQLAGLEIQTALLTGDDAVAGQRWQQHLNIPVFAELHPKDKVTHLQGVQGGVAMVGDGINDGPALATATVGIAVSQGADVAHEAADAILLADDLRTVPWLLRLAQQTMRKVKQNLAWAFVYNIIGLTLAMTGLLQPAIAALFMVLSNY